MRTKKMVSQSLGKREDSLAVMSLDQDQDLNQDLDLDLDLDLDQDLDQMMIQTSLKALLKDAHLHSVHSQIDSTSSLMMH